MNPGKHSKGSAHHEVEAGQATLPASAQASAEDENARIDRLVSLTYDSDANVRKQATIELSKIDDPRAIFALLELSADKDEKIKELARAGLGNFKEEKEAIVDLEKIFEDKAEGKTPEQDIEATKSKMMPSIEKIFSKHKVGKERMMSSLLKFFSSMGAGRKEEKGAPSTLMVSAHAVQPAGAVATPTAGTAPALSESEEEAAGEEAEDEEADLEATRVGQAAGADPLCGIDKMAHKSALEKVEAKIGILPNRSSPDALRKIRHPQSNGAHAPAAAPTQERMEEAINFPLPDGLEQKVNSPVSSIPAMAGAEEELKEEEEEARLPKSRIDYYQWAYALAITPGIKSAELEKEKKRLLKDIESEIKLAFELAVKRAKENGIESLSGLKPGMKKLSTFPMEVVEHTLVMVPAGKKKMAQMARLLVSDGKRTVPLYVAPQRGAGINKGDLISLRDVCVDYFTHSNELVLMLGKNGQILVTK